MKKMVFEIPVGKMPAKRKRWWQFWRKKGDSAEEAVADMISRYKEDLDWKHLDRSAKIGRMFGFFPIAAKLPLLQKEYWFPSPGDRSIDRSILRMTRIENIFKK